MKQYIEALKDCYQNGIDVDSRAGKVRKSFGYQMRFDLNKNQHGKQLYLNYYGFQRGQMMKEDQLKFYITIKKKILLIKKLFGLKMHKLITGKINLNLMVMLVKYMEYSGEILMELIKLKP